MEEAVGAAAAAAAILTTIPAAAAIQVIALTTIITMPAISEYKKRVTKDALVLRDLHFFCL